MKSVSTETTRTDVVWSQPGGPTLAIPIWCQECEFDPNGNRTKFGQMIDGRFQGEIVHLLFDGQAHVTEPIADDTSTGETIRRETVGPFGNTEESFYRNGELQSRALFSYDQYGHKIDELPLDGSGKQQFHTVSEHGQGRERYRAMGLGKRGRTTVAFSANIRSEDQGRAIR